MHIYSKDYLHTSAICEFFYRPCKFKKENQFQFWKLNYLYKNNKNVFCSNKMNPTSVFQIN